MGRELVRALNYGVRVFENPEPHNASLPLFDFVRHGSSFENQVVLRTKGGYQPFTSSGSDDFYLVQTLLYLGQVVNDFPIQSEQERDVLAAARCSLLRQNFQWVFRHFDSDNVREQSADGDATRVQLGVGLQSKQPKTEQRLPIFEGDAPFSKVGRNHCARFICRSDRELLAALVEWPGRGNYSPEHLQLEGHFPPIIRKRLECFVQLAGENVVHQHQQSRFAAGVSAVLLCGVLGSVRDDRVEARPEGDRCKFITVGAKTDEH
ncbi:MAG: hypothetical protein ACOH2Q_25005 [Rhodococcus sp. (in: high G+C Gram-positive bacteria)]